jgi:hypothetical protein
LAAPKSLAWAEPISAELARGAANTPKQAAALRAAVVLASNNDKSKNNQLRSNLPNNPPERD